MRHVCEREMEGGLDVEANGTRQGGGQAVEGVCVGV